MSLRLKFLCAVLFVLGVSLLMLSCERAKENLHSSKLDKERYFKQVFIKKFKMLELPCSLPHLPEFKEGEFSGANPETADSLFVGRGSMTCFGMSPDTSNYYTLFFFAPAATSIPVIMTFDKKGNWLSDLSIDYGCSGMNDSCGGFMKFEKDHSFVVEHTSVCCDYSLTEPPKKYFRKRIGRISEAGKIEFEDSSNN